MHSSDTHPQTLSRRGFLRLVGGAGLAILAWPFLQACGGGEARPGGVTKEGDVYVVKMGSSSSELAFFPDRLQIQPGETVRWVVESAGHSSTAYHPDNHELYQSRIPETAQPWNSDVLFNRGDSFEHTFTVEGVYNYYCIPHEGAGMVGAIVVGRAHHGPATGPVQSEIPQAARRKLEELVTWAKGLAS